jgi:hypothetical protein
MTSISPVIVCNISSLICECREDHAWYLREARIDITSR